MGRWDQSAPVEFEDGCRMTIHLGSTDVHICGVAAGVISSHMAIVKMHARSGITRYYEECVAVGRAAMQNSNIGLWSASSYSIVWYGIVVFNVPLDTL